MGEILSQKLSSQMFVIGLYAQGGQITTKDKGTTNIPQVPTGSLEDIISRKGYNTTFVNISRNKVKNKFNSWMFTEQYATEGYLTYKNIESNEQQLITKDQYDGIILLKEVSPLTDIE